MPGNVSCTIMTVCYEARKPFVYYPFSVQQKLDMKLMSPAQLATAIADRNITFANIDPRADMRAFRYAASQILVRRLIIY